MMTKSGKWTKEEESFLYDKWGVMSLPKIAEKLDRTEIAVRNKKDRMNLGSFLESGDYITVGQLLQAMGKRNDKYINISWIEKRGLPIFKKKVTKQRVKCVRINDFWKWAEKNKNFLDFSKFERYALGKEPEWVNAKRIRDIQSKNKYKKIPWSKDEEEYLLFLVNQYKYTYKEISERIRRTDGAIRRKLLDLGIKARPIAENSIKWTEEEVKTLKELISLGYDYNSIGTKINTKSEKAIRAKVYRLYGTEMLDKIDINNDIVNKESSNKVWTAEELQQIKELAFEGYNASEISKCIIDRSKEAISQQMIRLIGTSDVKKIRG